MPQLQERGYYENRYDRLVVDVCRMYESLSKNESPKEASGMNPKQTKKARDYVIGLMIYFKKGELAEKREEKIRKWMEEDRELDEFFEKASLPSQYCVHCDTPMQLTDKILWTGTSKEPDRVLFMYKCRNCDYKRSKYDNGEEYKIEPTICNKCQGENVKTDRRNSKSDFIFTYTCLDCLYKWEDRIKNRKKEVDPNYEVDRARFCLTEKELYEYQRQKSGLERAWEIVNEDKKEKQATSGDTNIPEIKHLDFSGLKKLLEKTIKRSKYIDLVISNPTIQRNLIVNITVLSTSVDKEDFQSFIQTMLDGTNWKLVEKSIVAKLGIIQCRLEGYEKTINY